MPEFSASPEFDDLANGLDKADALFIPFATRAAAESIEAIKEIIQVYPPQPARDRAKTFNTYVRGVGHYPKSSFVEAAEPGGYRIKRTSKARIRYTSQQMDKRFQTTVKAGTNTVTAELRNNASYSGYVIGWESHEPLQTPFHAQTGWVSADKAIEDSTEAIVASLENAVKEFISAL